MSKVHCAPLSLTNCSANLISHPLQCIPASAERSGKPCPQIISHDGRTNHCDSIKRFKEFKNFNKRICLATDVLGLGVDIEYSNLTINYDMSVDTDSYLRRVGRVSRSGKRSMSILFVSSEEDEEVLEEIEARFEVTVPEFSADGVKVSTYLAIWKSQGG